MKVCEFKNRELVVLFLQIVKKQEKLTSKFVNFTRTTLSKSHTTFIKSDRLKMQFKN